jgi:hypothetical protein
MALHHETGISVESWVQLTRGVRTRYEVDRRNGLATLFFGERGEYVLHICRENLDQFADLAGQAMRDLDAPERPVPQ